MAFNTYLAKKRNPIQKAVDAIFSRWEKSVGQTQYLNDLTQLLLQSNQGGKNIRGALVCFGYDLVSSSRTSKIYPAAAAYEILHTSLLIHDDIMDKSLLRRGEKALYQKLGGDHYGISQAMCLGDAGFFLATQTINSTKFDAGIIASVVSQFSQIVLDTITGQMLDIQLAKSREKIAEKDVITIARLKTAQYTIAGPLIVGALLAGADQNFIKKLSAFGDALGIAFQIKDDILGIFGDEKMIGKSVTSDIEEGKNTLLFVHAFHAASQQQKNFLSQHYGKGTITPQEQQQMKQIFQDSGAVMYAEKKIRQYAREANILISQITNKKEMQNILNDFITYLVERKK